MSEQVKTKKKSFVEPSLDGDILQDAVEATAYLHKCMQDDTDVGNYMDKVGCYLHEPSADAIPSATTKVGQKYCEIFKDYKEKQHKLDPELVSSSKLGIMGGDARFKGNNQQKVCASVPLSADMLKLDHEVVGSCKDLLPAGAVSIPSVLLTEADRSVADPAEARVWRYLHGTDTCKTVAIVPLTPCTLFFVPHSQDFQQRWEDLTFGGMATNATHPKHHILSKSFREKIDNMDVAEDEDEGVEGRDAIFCIALRPGMIFLTHRGMPVYLEGSVPESDDEDEDEDDEVRNPFIVKTVAFEVPTKGSKRRNLTEQALNTGYFTNNQLHENFYFKCLPMLKDGPPDADDNSVFCMDRATKDDVPWFFEQRKKVVKKPVSVSSEKKKPVVPEKKKTNVPSNEDRMNAAFEKHSKLKTTIEELDQRAWKDSHSDNANEKEKAVKKAHEDGDLKAKIIRTYEDALNTLDNKVNEAVEGAKELAGIETMFDSIESTLEKIDAMLPEKAKQERKMSKSKRAALEKFKAIDSELYKQVKKITELLQQVENLLVASKEKVEKLESKKRPRDKSTGGGGGSSAEQAQNVVDLPSVEEDACSPYVLQGKTNIVEYMRKYPSEHMVLSDTVKALKNDHLKHMVQRMIDIHKDDVAKLKELFSEVRDGKDPNSISLDVGKHFTYYNTLNLCIELVQNYEKKAPVNKQSRIECKNCEEKATNFLESGYCAICYAELEGKRYHNQLDARVLVLERLKDEEEDLLEGVEGPVQKKWEIVEGLYEDWNRAADDFFEAPKKRTWDAFKPLCEEMEKLLPDAVDSDEEDYYDEDDEEVQDEPKKGRLEGVLSLKNLPDDEEEASFSDSSEERELRNDKKRSRSHDDNGMLSDRALKVMAAIPDIEVHKKILHRYVDPTKHVLLNAYLDELKTDHPFTYSIEFSTDNKDTAVPEHHTHYLDATRANTVKDSICVEGVLTGTVVKHPVKF